jgi:hypothetical protein
LLTAGTTCLAAEESVSVYTQQGVFQEQIIQVMTDKHAIFTSSEKYIRVYPANSVRSKTRIVRWGGDKEIPLEKLESGQWIVVIGSRFFNYENHVVTVDADVIYAVSGKLSDAELKKLQ